MTTTTAQPNDEKRVWLHFPQVLGSGCEGVLVLLASEKPLRALLVDGSQDQLQHLQRWSDYSRRPGETRLEITWIISHFHSDHYEHGLKLLRDPSTSSTTQHIQDHVVRIFCPAALDPAPAFADQAAAAMKEAGPKFAMMAQAARKQDGSVPRVEIVPLGQASRTYQGRHVEIEVHGGPYRNQTRSGNTRSLIVVGVAHAHFDTNPVPFAFVLPGDATSKTWTQLQALLDEHAGLAAKLPIAVLKLAHHGAANCNPEWILKRLFGSDSTLRPQQLAVRVRNRTTMPSNAAGLENSLQKIGLSTHDTRDKGELWVALQQGKPLTSALKRTDPALGLPPFFQL